MVPRVEGLRSSCMSHVELTRVLDRAADARVRASQLLQISELTILHARATRAAVLYKRLHSPVRRLLRLRSGGSDGEPLKNRSEIGAPFCPRCAAEDIVELGFGSAGADGLLRVGCRCRQCDTQFYLVRPQSAGEEMSIASRHRQGRCRKVIISKGSGLACDGCADLVSPEHSEFRARLADGDTLRFHGRCFTRWYNDTQR